MTNNEMIVQLQDNVIAVVNSSPMPLAVKGIVLENTLLRIKVQLKEEAAQAQAAQQAAEPEQQEPVQEAESAAPAD